MKNLILFLFLSLNAVAQNAINWSLQYAITDHSLAPQEIFFSNEGNIVVGGELSEGFYLITVDYESGNLLTETNCVTVASCNDHDGIIALDVNSNGEVYMIGHRLLWNENYLTRITDIDDTNSIWIVDDFVSQGIENIWDMAVFPDGVSILGSSGNQHFLFFYNSLGEKEWSQEIDGSIGAYGSRQIVGLDENTIAISHPIYENEEFRTRISFWEKSTGNLLSESITNEMVWTIKSVGLEFLLIRNKGIEPNGEFVLSKISSQGIEEVLLDYITPSSVEPQGFILPSDIYVDSANDIFIVHYGLAASNQDGDNINFCSIDKFSSSGAQIWNKTYNLDGELGFAIQDAIFVDDDTIIFTGRSDSFTDDVDDEMFITSIDLNADVIANTSQHSDQSMFNIFPNPTTNNIRIALPSIQTGESLVAKLSSSNGVQVMLQSLTNNDSIDISGLESGVYFLQLYDSQMLVVFSDKFLKL